jgi:hypothetical protein
MVRTGALDMKRQSAKPRGADPAPEPAARAILTAFDKYEIVGMPVAHGMKDVDDFILSLIRNPTFPDKVNDIAVECGNSLYQPELDRYIAGEDVSFTSIRKVWRNTTQPMCGLCGFFEQFFPLVRTINQKLPEERRLRVLAGDPPIDWEQGPQEQRKLLLDRDATTASVMEIEVLSKKRKALMLFGTFHLMHGMGAVSIYERNYPNLTFVISDLGAFDTESPSLSVSPFVSWPIPSLARAKGTWLGALELAQFFPPGPQIDEECNICHEIPEEFHRPMEEAVDAFLYLGPQDLRLWEQIPAQIALDDDYMHELDRRAALQDLPLTWWSRRQILDSAEHALLRWPKEPDPELSRRLVEKCLARKRSRDNSPQ